MSNFTEHLTRYLIHKSINLELCPLLFREDYGKQLENKLINNKYHKHPWYFIYKQRECIFRVYAKEDMPTHTANIETFTVDICNKTIKAMWSPDVYLEVK